MNRMHLLALAAALCGPAAAAADSTIDGAQLGRMRGILDTCARVNPQQASALLLRMKALIGDANKESVAQVTATDAYQQSYQSITTELNGMDAEAMAKACRSYLE